MDPIRLEKVQRLERTYAIKMSAQGWPQLFPRSAYSLTTLHELLDKVPWKEAGSSRKFIVCFNEYRERDKDDDAPTPAPVGKQSSRKAKAKSAALVSRQKPPRVKMEPLKIRIKQECPKSSRKEKGKAYRTPIEEIDLTLGDLDTLQLPSRKRSISQIEEPQSSRTTPTQASVAGEQDLETDTTSSISEEYANLTPIEDSFPRYPQRSNRRPTWTLKGSEDIHGKK